MPERDPEPAGIQVRESLSGRRPLILQQEEIAGRDIEPRRDIRYGVDDLAAAFPGEDVQVGLVQALLIAADQARVAAAPQAAGLVQHGLGDAQAVERERGILEGTRAPRPAAERSHEVPQRLLGLLARILLQHQLPAAQEGGGLGGVGVLGQEELEQAALVVRRRPGPRPRAAEALEGRSQYPAAARPAIEDSRLEPRLEGDRHTPEQLDHLLTACAAEFVVGNRDAGYRRIRAASRLAVLP